MGYALQGFIQRGEEGTGILPSHPKDLRGKKLVQ